METLTERELYLAVIISRLQTQLIRLVAQSSDPDSVAIGREMIGYTYRALDEFPERGNDD